MHVATFGGFVISFSFLSLLCFQQDVFGEDGTPEESTPTAESSSEVSTLRIPFEKYELDNGLDVILSEDHSIPFVQVNIWYNVGSKDEVEGRTGFAHLFEHLMFQGSEHYNQDYFAPLQPIGAVVNGTTSFDRTNYFEGVPSEQLPLALWLESDRMGWLLPALTEDKLKNQQDVVRNERRQRYEVRPYGEVWVWLFENLYPAGHPYHIPTIGKHEDIENANMDDVQNFFKQWYPPNNASLVVCGDFDPAVAKDMIQKYFGEIPRGEETAPVTEAPAELTEEKIVRKTDNVSDDKVWIAWLTPKTYTPGDAEFDILSNLMTEGKDSILYKKLVDELQIAKDVDSFQYSARLQGQFIITATAASGHSTDELVKEIDAILADFKTISKDDEELQAKIDVAKLNWESSFYNGISTISSKANILNTYNTFLDNPDYIQQDLQRFLDVTSESLMENVNTYLDSSKRVVLHVSPEPPKEESGEDTESTK
jgi:zinc protease